jgi:hypothetical protein
MPALSLRVGDITIGDIAFGLAAIVGLLAIVRYQPDRSRWAWATAAGLAVLAALLAHSHIGRENANLAVAGRMVFLWVIWRWTCTATLGRTEHVRRSLTMFLCGCAASAAAGAAQVVLGMDVLGVTLTGNTDARASGLAGHVNDQGGQLAVAICIGTALWLHESGLRGRLTMLTGMSAGGLILSGSVTGMLATVSGVLFVVASSGRLKRTVQVVAVIALGIWLAVRLQARLTGGDPLSRFQSATGENGDVSTLRLRLETMNYAWTHILRDPWTGVGLDSASGGTYDSVTQAHNIFLLFWYQGGIVYLLAVVIALLAAGALLFRRVRRRSSLGASLAGGFVAAMVFAQTAPIMYQRYFWFTAVLAFALIAVDRRRTQVSTSREPARAAN